MFEDTVDHRRRHHRPRPLAVTTPPAASAPTIQPACVQPQPLQRACTPQACSQQSQQ